jgi:Xaa-Pro aminopeptidase
VNHADRLDRLAGALAGRGVDALFVTDLVNVRYLTGYAGSNGAVVVRADGATFLTDFRYIEAAEPIRAFAEVRRCAQDIVGAAAGMLGELTGGAARVGFEAGSLTVERHRVLAGGAAGALVPTVGVVEELRAVKDEEEQAAIRAATAAVEPVLRGLADEGLVGRSERDVAWRIRELFHESGAEDVSFPPIVAGGANGDTPHATPRADAIDRGTLVTIDLGCVLDGYCSDCTRTFATGELPAQLAEIYEFCRVAQAAALAAVRDGARAADVDAVARDAITAAGYGERFGHGTGHGVGLAVHEGPRLTPTSTATLRAGNVVSVEPGIYLPGVGGVRIEDLVIVTADGAERLTGYPKELTTVA